MKLVNNSGNVEKVFSRAISPKKKGATRRRRVTPPCSKISFREIATELSDEDSGLRFFFYGDFDLRGDVAEHFDGHLLFADDFDRLGKLYLALVDLEALRGEPLGNVRGRYGAEHLIVLAGFAREFQRNDV